MTMFSPKPPFDLADFLSKPASPTTRRLRVMQRRAPVAEQEIADPIAEPVQKKPATNK